MRTLLVALFLTAAAANAQHPYDWTPTQTFTDAAHGVAFQVPHAWRRTTESQSMFTPMLMMVIKDPKPTVVFYDRPYANTNVSALYFTYAHKRTTDASACNQLADLGDDQDTKPRTIMINHIRFIDHAVGGAGLGSSADGHLYSTFRAATCYLFETTTALSNNVDGIHLLKQPAYAAIDAHLLAIMKTVQFVAKTPSSGPSAASSSPHP